MSDTEKRGMSATDLWMSAVRSNVDRAIGDRVRAEHQQGPRPDGSWGCACGWVQDKPHRDHLAEKVAEALGEPW